MRRGDDLFCLEGGVWLWTRRIALDFGPGKPGDSYEHPLVAACCGEYDFDLHESEQPAHWFEAGQEAHLRRSAHEARQRWWV